MTYALSEEDRRKLVMAIHDLRVRAPGDDPSGTPIAGAALSLLAGLPKVQEPLPPADEYPMSAICAGCGKTYGDHIGPVCPNLSRGRFFLKPAAMKEHPQP